jgi:hypothetical protein
MFSGFYPRWIKRLLPSARRRRPGRRPYRPFLEALEDRWLPAPYTVINTLDDGPGSLRDAIIAVNVGANDGINFNISGNGQQTIFVGSSTGLPLPALYQNNVLIDGTSQPGFSPGAPTIVLDGSQAGANANGLELRGILEDVRGLGIVNFSGDGILLDNGNGNGNFVLLDDIVTDGSNALPNTNGIEVKGSNNWIGFDQGNGGFGNTIKFNTQDGILIDAGANANLVASNSIASNNGNGVEVAGSNNQITGAYFGFFGPGNDIFYNAQNGILLDNTATGNFVRANTISVNGGNGVEVAGNNNTIGGNSVAARNTISLNAQNGVLLDGTGNQVQGNFIGTDPTGVASEGNTGNGVEIFGNNNTIGGITAGTRNVISGSIQDGVLIDSTAGGVLVQGNYIGTDATGSVALGNANGVEVFGNNDAVGGVSAAARNVISGNVNDGILIGNSATGALVQGNYLGINAAGNKALPNVNGIEVFATAVLGSTAAGRNLVSGNSNDGILIHTGANGTLVGGNYVGTDAAGAKAVPNANGIEVFATNVVIGSSAATRNLISGNKNDGILLDNGATGVLVQSNYVGTTAFGNLELGNNNGVEVAAANATIGGTTLAARNLISGNTNDGVLIDSGASAALVEGNYIGINYNSTSALSNHNGVEVAASGAIIGGTVPAARNVISGNTQAAGDTGVLIDKGASGVVVQGNYIGTNAAGTAALGNWAGVAVSGSNVTIGGTVAGARNLISGNNQYGIQLSQDATGVQVEGNFIGTNGAGNLPLGNLIGIHELGTNDTIGGLTAAAANVIAGSGTEGIFVEGATGLKVQGNFIGTNASGAPGLGNGQDGIGFLGAGANDIIGGTIAGAGNVIGFNVENGILLAVFTTGVQVQGNFIGANAARTLNLANGKYGVEIDFANNNTVGGTAAGAGNTIANNRLGGVLVSGGTSDAIRGNSIFANGRAQQGPRIVLANGGNDNVSAPVLTSATFNPATKVLTIKGTLTSTAAGTFTLEFFANPDNGDAEGKLFLGSHTVNAINGTVNFTVTITVTAAGFSSVSTPIITATATDPKADTSAFSNGVHDPVAVVLGKKPGGLAPAPVRHGRRRPWA